MVIFGKRCLFHQLYRNFYWNWWEQQLQRNQKIGYNRMTKPAGFKLKVKLWINCFRILSSCLLNLWLASVDNTVVIGLIMDSHIVGLGPFNTGVIIGVQVVLGLLSTIKSLLEIGDGWFLFSWDRSKRDTWVTRQAAWWKVGFPKYAIEHLEFALVKLIWCCI